MAIQEVNDNIYYVIFLVSIGNVFLSSAIIFFYVRYQKKFFLQRAEMQKSELKHKQHLLYATIKSQEDERTRISKDLHDHIGSSLSELRMMISQASLMPTATNELRPGTEKYKQTIDRIIEDVRDISHSLSPAGLSIWGVQYCLEEFCEKMAAATGIDIRPEDHTDDALRHLSFDAALSLFRIIQELVTNTIKHAGANQISIKITEPAGHVRIEYRDNGKGMDIKQSSHGIGLYNIESRLSVMQATHQIVSAPGDGYTFIIELNAREAIN